METRESQKPIIDVNGREIKIGSFGRLSEEGRERVSHQAPNFLKNSANLRFKVIDIDVLTQKIFIEPTEISTSSIFQLDPECLVIEK